MIYVNERSIIVTKEEFMELLDYYEEKFNHNHTIETKVGTDEVCEVRRYPKCETEFWLKSEDYTGLVNAIRDLEK